MGSWVVQNPSAASASCPSDHQNLPDFFLCKPKKNKCTGYIPKDDWLTYQSLEQLVKIHIKEVECIMHCFKSILDSAFQT